MKRLSGALVAVAVMLTTAAAAYANHYQKYWPLKNGNSWTYDNLRWEFQSQINVDDAWAGLYHVTNLPTLGEAWLAWSGNTLYIWDAEEAAWNALFRFGAAAGTTYTVSLADRALWNSVQVTVAAKNVTHRLARLDRTLTNCVRFTFAFPGVADAGLVQAVFAPNRGLVFFEETSIAGPVESELTSAVYNGRNWGLNYVRGVEGGNFTNYPTGTNQILLINTQAEWTAFYALHKPGQTAPDLDLSAHTVVVILAGPRASSGYTVKVDKAVWNYPLNSVKVHVDEITPTGIVLWVITNPYHIVTLDRKVFSANLRWEVIPATDDPASDE